MKEIKTYDEMNKQICGLLKLSGDKTSLYARARIQELEEEVKHEHEKQMEWFEIASEYKAENKQLTARLDNAVELKVKIGDTIYMPWVFDGTDGIATLKVIGVDFRGSENEFIYMTDLDSDNGAYLHKYNYGIFYKKDFDDIVYTDYDKAEAKLKELQGGEL